MTEDITSFYDAQFEMWPEVREKYESLGDTRRKVFTTPEMPYPLIVQYNPSRAKSTGAKVDAKSISERPCFLCEKNRPERQLSGKSIDGWDILINPYPIFPVHFTIASRKHEPQGELPIEGMAMMLDLVPECTIFYNGAQAGASAPDHLHFQAILKSELPLLSFLEEHHDPQDSTSSVKTGADFQKESKKVHYPFRSYVITPDAYGHALIQEITSRATALSNSFMWADNKGRLRMLLFERQAHRPQCYYREEEDRLMVSPGAIDMAGILILPRKEDFDKITLDDINEIYSQV